MVDLPDTFLPRSKDSKLGQSGARIQVPNLVLKFLTLQLSLGILSPTPCLNVKFIELLPL